MANTLMFSDSAAPAGFAAGTRRRLLPRFDIMRTEAMSELVIEAVREVVREAV